MAETAPTAAAVDTVLAPFVEAEFHCGRCGKLAGRVSVRGRGAPDAPGTLFSPDASRERVLVEFANQRLTTWPEEPDGIERTLRAIDRRDPADLYAVDREFAPFWCRACDAIYCPDHWTLWDLYDPDYAGWYEETRGRCPAGHERRIFD